jgi:hypothetical protein
MSQPSHIPIFMLKLDTKLVYETPGLVEQGTVLHSDLTAKVYRGVHALPPS